MSTLENTQGELSEKRRDHFLNPANIPATPLIEVNDPSINPFAADGVRLFLKLACESPLGHIKLWPVWNMLECALQKGYLKGVHTLCMATSGNAGDALIHLAPLFGIFKIVLYVPVDIADDKEDALLMSGATAQKCEKPINEAEEAGKQRGWLNLDQYRDPANPEAYEKWLAPELWQQTDRAMTLLAVGLGSLGTMKGCQRFFRGISAAHSIEIVGGTAEPVRDDVPGVRSDERLKAIGFDCEEADFPIELDISSADSYSASTLGSRVTGRRLGPSSGLAMLAGLRFVHKMESTGVLDTYRNARKDVVLVAICPDTYRPYVSKYKTHLRGYQPRSIREMLKMT